MNKNHITSLLALLLTTAFITTTVQAQEAAPKPAIMSPPAATPKSSLTPRAAIPKAKQLTPRGTAAKIKPLASTRPLGEKQEATLNSVATAHRPALNTNLAQAN